MKTQNLETGLSLKFCLWLGVLGLFFGGCHSVGYKTGDTTAVSLQKTARSLQAESTALDRTINALNDLVSNPAADLKRQFKGYSASLNRLVASVEKTDAAIARLRTQSDSYLAAWDSELSAMNYEAVRQQSESRKLSVSNQVFMVCQRYDEAQNVVKPLISYFQDIQKALGTDLTADGLAAARQVVQNAGENSRKIQTALVQLTGEMNASSIRLSSTIPEESRRETLQKTSDTRAEIRGP